MDISNLPILNYKNALELCQYSARAYYQPNIVVGTVECIYDEQMDYQVLAFQGSEQIKDWLADSKFTKVARDGIGEIHNGFADSVDKIKSEILKINPTKTTLITGHSLGGAIATVFALVLKQRGYKVGALYNFGSPRVGNNDFFKIYTAMNIPSWRFVNSCDIVPTIPHIGFDHIGQSVYLSSDGKRLSSQESAWSWKVWTVEAKRFLAHKMENYLNSLKIISAA